MNAIDEFSRKMARPAGFEPATPGLEGPLSARRPNGYTKRLYLSRVAWSRFPQYGRDFRGFALRRRDSHNRLGRGGLGPMTKRLARHQGNQLILSVRYAFLEAVRTWCPEVLEDLRRTVYVPLEARVGRDAAAVLLRSPLPVDREVETGILWWARRWRLDTVWIRDEAWRTLRFWAAHPRAARGKDDRLRWAPLIRTRPLVGAPSVRRPRRRTLLTWLVRLRVCRPAVAARDFAAEYHIELDTIRVEVNRLARSLDLPVRPRGRPRGS